MSNLTRIVISTLTMVGAAVPVFAVDNPAHSPAPVTPAAAAVPVGTPAPEASTPGPKIQFATPVYDFGKVQAGELVKYSFVFTNNGDQPLELSNVQPSCGCTTAGEWSRKVPAGQTGQVSIQFNSANFNGQVFKTISVTSNDKTKPVTVLQLKGTIWKPIELVPQYTVINLPPDATNASATIRILNHLDEPLTVFSAECNNHSFSVTLATNQPGKEYQLTIASIAELNSGNVQGKVALKTSSAKTPAMDVPFWVNVQPVISVVPPRVMLPQAPLKAKAPATVTIQNNSTNALTLNDAAVNVPGVEVQLKEVQPGRIYNALMTFPEGFEAPAGQPIVLTMKSSQPRMPEIRIPVVQSARPMTAPAVLPKPQAVQPPPTPTSATAANSATHSAVTR